MNLTSWIGLTGSALLIGTVVTVTARAHRHEAAFRLLYFLIPFFAAFCPLEGLPLAGYVRGVIGDLSVTSWTLLVAMAFPGLRGKEVFRTDDLSVLMLLILGSGLFLYPSALGLTYLDTYALGYGSKSLLTAFFVSSLLAWYLEYPLVTFCMTASVLAYSLRLFESRNLWDYWIDPLVTLYAIVALSTLGRRRGGR